jgi:hypothetical protein
MTVEPATMSHIEHSDTITTTHDHTSNHSTHNNIPPLVHLPTSPSRILPIQRHAPIMPRPVMVDLMYDLGHHLRKFWIVGCKLFLCYGDAGVGEEGVGDEAMEAVEGEGEWEDEEEDGESEEERS